MIDEKEKLKIIKNLTSLGLSEKDAEVYFALFKIGEVGSSKIIQETQLHGQFVYNSLLNLEEKGLIQHVIKKGRKKFSAKSPDILLNLIKFQESVAIETANRLSQLMVMPKEQRSETFQGLESYIAHEFDLLESAPTNSHLLIIGGQGNKFAKLMGENLKRYQKISADKGMDVRYIGSRDEINGTEGLEYQRQHRPNFNYRILPGLFTGLVNTNIWTDALNLNIYGEPVTSFTIYNKEIAESYRQFFETLWNMADDSKNEQANKELV